MGFGMIRGDLIPHTNKRDRNSSLAYRWAISPKVTLKRYSSRNREFDAYRRAIEVFVSNWLPVDVYAVSAYHPPYLHRRSNSEFIYFGRAERGNRV